MLEPGRIDPGQIDANVRSLTRRPLLSLAFVVIFAAFAIWWFTGGSANGSAHQAEQLVISSNNQAIPGIPANRPIQSVHCTQQGQNIFSRIIGLVSPSGNGSNNNASHAPFTYYSCTGYYSGTSGVPAYWCVAYPPQDGTNPQPRVEDRQPGNTCP
jgi:hypothetical protein